MNNPSYFYLVLLVVFVVAGVLLSKAWSRINRLREDRRYLLSLYNKSTLLLAHVLEHPNDHGITYQGSLSEVDTTQFHLQFRAGKLLINTPIWEDNFFQFNGMSDDAFFRSLSIKPDNLALGLRRELALNREDASFDATEDTDVRASDMNEFALLYGADWAAKRGHAEEIRSEAYNDLIAQHISPVTTYEM